MENEQSPIEGKSNNEVLKYSLWGAGLILLCFVAAYSQWEDTSLKNNWGLLFFAATGNFVTYIIYAGIIWGVSLWFNKEKTFKRYMKVLSWTVILISGYVISHKSKDSATANTKYPEHATKNIFFKMLSDTCEYRMKKVYPNDTAEIRLACNCMVNKAEQRWTEEDINRPNFLTEPGKGDSAAAWIKECFGATGFYGYEGK